MQFCLVVGDALPVVARVLTQHEAVAEVSHLGRLGLGHLPEAERASVEVQEGVNLGEHQPVLDHRFDSEVVQGQAVLDVAALGKLSRSEVVTVRFDQKLRYLAELGARKHRRTLSSYIEWAVEQSLKEVMLFDGDQYNGDGRLSIADEAPALWDTDESERFIRLATNYPELLTHEEQERWKMLSDSDLLGPAKVRQPDGQIRWNRAVLEDVVYPMVRRCWPGLLAAYNGDAEEQRKWVAETLAAIRTGKVYSGYTESQSKSIRSGFDDMDEKIPF